MKEKGIYTSMAALLVVVMLSTSIAYISSTQHDAGVKAATASASGLHFAWVNARYVADKAVGKALYDGASGPTCAMDDSGVQAAVESVLSMISTRLTCTMSGFSALPDYDYTFTITCANADGSASFSESITIKKSVGLVQLSDMGVDIGCDVTVSDEETGLVELSGTV